MKDQEKGKIKRRERHAEITGEVSLQYAAL